MKNCLDGHLSVHCHECGCATLFDDCEVLARRRDKNVREIIEAQAINRSCQSCVSTPSIDLLDKEVALLESSV